jgi:hypothetical protein
MVIPSTNGVAGDVCRGGGALVVLGITHRREHQLANARKFGSGGILNPAPGTAFYPTSNAPLFVSKSGRNG